MPNSILTQDSDGQELFNAISSFFLLLRLETFFESVMHRRRKVFRYLISSSTSYVMSSLAAACTCSRKQVPSGKHFQRILTIVFLTVRKRTGYDSRHFCPRK